MAQQEAAKALAKVLSNVARYSVILGIGGSALQASMYTGERRGWRPGDGTRGLATRGWHGLGLSSAGPAPCMHSEIAHIACNFNVDAAAVDGGERCIMFDRFSGVVEKPVSEGTHFRMPWVQTPHIMDIRTRPRLITSVSGTKGES